MTNAPNPKEHTPLNEDKSWIALMTALSALTSALRYISEKNHIDEYDALTEITGAIKAITEAFGEYNL